MEHPDRRGQQAGRGQAHAEGKLFRAHVGTGAIREGRQCRTTSHRFPPRLCRGQPPPAGANPPPRRGIWKTQGHRWGSSARPRSLQAPLLIQGPRGIGCFPRARPSLMGASVTSPSWLSDKPIPPLTQPWRVFSPLTGSPKRTNACHFSKLATI